MPFFDVGSANYWERTLGCTRATFGDVGILLLAYTVVSILARNRNWMHYPKYWMIGIYLLTGLGITGDIANSCLWCPVRTSASFPPLCGYLSR
jgi:hypothetical protein